MNSRNILIALALSTALYADQQPIGNAFITGMKEMKIEVKTTDSSDSIEVITPIRAIVLMGGGRTYSSRSENVKDMLERQCFAYGGDVYFTIKDSFGDTVEAHSFDHAKVKALSSEQRFEYTKLNSEDKVFFFTKPEATLESTLPISVSNVVSSPIPIFLDLKIFNTILRVNRSIPVKPFIRQKPNAIPKPWLSRLAKRL